MTETIPKTVPPLPREHNFERDLSPGVALEWLGAGWRDLTSNPGVSVFYGVVVFIVSANAVFGLFALAMDYILLPALAGFMVVGPLIAIGLYEKSRRIAQNEPITLAGMIFVRPKSGGQVLFTGALLGLLMLLWMRAAVLLYALFFGLQPFPGLSEILPMLLSTSTGWWLLIVGTFVGGFFAAFAFAISVFSIPMLLDKHVDAFTAMGTSMALVWSNLSVMLVWGAIVLVLTTIGLVTGLVGLIIVFPLLGHATWHAYLAMRP